MSEIDQEKTVKRKPLSRWLIYCACTLIFLFFAALLLIYGLLYSESGSRWALSKAQDWSPLEIQQSSGSLARELTALNIEYKHAGVGLKIDRITYRIADINWWQRIVVFDYIQIGHVSIELPDKEPAKTTKPLPEARPVELPLSIVLNELFIQKITINGDKQSYGPLWAKLTGKDKSIDIDKLHLIQDDLKLKLEGQVTLNTRWPFEIMSDWSYSPEQISGVGKISGDVTGMMLSQKTRFNGVKVQGNADIKAEVMFYPMLSVDSTIKSERLIFPSTTKDRFETVFKDITMSVGGNLDDYQLSINASTEQSVEPWFNTTKSSQNKNQKAIYHNQISLTGQGNPEQLNVSSMVIEGNYGRLSAESTLNLSPRVSIDSRFNTDSFNPQWILPEWPGKINGSGHISALQSEQGQWQVSLNDINLQGQIKNRPLTMATNASWQNDIIDLNPLSIEWGDNDIHLKGQLNSANQTVARQLVFNFNLSEPQLLISDLNGDIKANGQLSGSIKALDYEFNLTANNVGYQDQAIRNLKTTGQGQWPKQLNLDITANEVVTAKQLFPSIKLMLSGSRRDHQLDGDIRHENLTTKITFKGGWLDNRQQWRGQLMQHQIQVNESDMLWKLQAPADISMGKQIQLSSTCWQSVQGDGEACAELDIDATTDLSAVVKINLKNLQISLFKAMLPHDLSIDGMLDGTADVIYQQSKLALSADLRTQKATMYYQKGLENGYQVAIEKAHLTAQQEAGQTRIKTDIELEDDSFLSATANIEDQSGSTWPIINTNITGEIKNSRFLAALSPELEQLQGEFKLTGQVNGALNRPSVDLTLSQQSGFLILRQTGSRLTNIILTINSSQPGLIDLNLDADSESGSIQTIGQLKLGKDWTYQGRIKGADFRLLTLPEITVNINPELDVDASQEAINISGRLILPMADVNIKSLPPSATTTSADVTIHRPNQKAEQDAFSIPIHYDVITEIINPISLRIMGLQAKMAGQLRIFNNRQQTFAEGRLNLTEGFYKLYGQRLTIERGELIFNGPLENPALDVKATRKSDNGSVTAGILLSGTVNQIQSTLYSEPAMSQLEILSYLATGRGLNEGGSTNGQQLAQAAILLGLKRGDSVFSQLQNAFGIDVLTIKQGANNEDSFIEAGQNISEDLYVGYSQSLFNRLGFWILRYKINDALRLETTQGENQTVDLIYVRKKE